MSLHRTRISGLRRQGIPVYGDSILPPIETGHPRLLRWDGFHLALLQQQRECMPHFLTMPSEFLWRIPDELFGLKAMDSIKKNRN